MSDSENKKVDIFDTKGHITLKDAIIYILGIDLFANIVVAGILSSLQVDIKSQAGGYILVSVWAIVSIVVCGTKYLGAEKDNIRKIQQKKIDFFYIPLLAALLIAINDSMSCVFPYLANKIGLSLGEGVPIEEPRVLILAILSMGILAPVVEELLMRGMFYNGLRHRKMGMAAASLCSSFVWAVMHFDLIQGVIVFVLGIMYATVYELYGNILIPILFHISNNIYAILKDWVYADEMVPIGDLDVTVVVTQALLLVAELCGVIFIIYRKYKQQRGTIK